MLFYNVLVAFAIAVVGLQITDWRRSHMCVLGHDPLLAGQILTVVTLAIVKNQNFSERVNKGPEKVSAIQGFVRSIPNFDRTLSVDRPLFAALLL